MPEAMDTEATTQTRVEFRVSPDRYRHWKLSTDGPVATLTMDVDEQGGLVPGYELKLNSYDLGVDIELYDAVQRLRFEHPEVRVVVITSGKQKIFCAGANIRMLAASPHGWKVNFCKFTNETRNGIEDATANSGQTYVAAVNGTASGGGYELALACDHIMLVDDRSSAVSLPELPLLGVLPGTGGLTRVVRQAARPAGPGRLLLHQVRGRRREEGRAVAAGRRGRAAAPVGRGRRRAGGRAGRALHPPAGRRRASSWPRWPRPATTTRSPTRYVAARFDREAGKVDISVKGPQDEPPASIDDARGAEFWPLAMTRELDDLILDLRTNEPGLGTWIFRTEGDHGPGARLRRAAAGELRRLVRQRGPALPQAHAAAPRRDQPQPDRGDRAGQLLRRLAARAGPRRRPVVPAGRGVRGEGPGR